MAAQPTVVASKVLELRQLVLDQLKQGNASLYNQIGTYLNISDEDLPGFTMTFQVKVSLLEVFSIVPDEFLLKVISDSLRDCFDDSGWRDEIASVVKCTCNDLEPTDDPFTGSCPSCDGVYDWPEPTVTVVPM